MPTQTQKPATFRPADHFRDACPTCGTKKENLLVGNTDAHEALILAALILACTPFMVILAAGAILFLILCAAIALSVGLTLAGVFAVFLAAAFGAAVRDG
jgi:hypothetical protein